MTTHRTRDIELSVELDATPEEVFRAVTDGTELAKWMAPEARVTPPSEGKKGSIWRSWGGGMDAESEIEIWDAPRRIRHSAGENPETKAPLYADWSIEARQGGTTTLRLVHSGFSASADWDEEFDSHERGWMLMLANLRHYFARHPKASAVHLPFMTKIELPRQAAWTALLAKLALSSAPRVGESHRIATALGELIVKIDLVNEARDLAFVVQDLDDALLRFSLEGGSKSPATFAYGYVIAFGSSSERARELATNMGALIDSLAS